MMLLKMMILKIFMHMCEVYYLYLLLKKKVILMEAINIRPMKD